MLTCRSACAALLTIAFCVVPAAAGNLVPFRGNWDGLTESAVPTGDPNVVLVTSRGTGNASHLGNYSMVSPHLTFLDTFTVIGQQIFTAANGDTVTADISGQFHPTPDGALEATLDGTITGGTGRFSGATGSYSFHIISRQVIPGTFASTATIDGEISSPGANN